MPVILRRSDDLPPHSGYDSWAAVGDVPTGLDPAGLVKDLAFLLEDSFDRVSETWIVLARHLASDASAALSHTVACAANISDFGQMLAWERLIAEWAAGRERVLVVCDDPWLYRHVETLEGVSAARAPSLLWPAARLFLRGYGARGVAALRFLRAAVGSRRLGRDRGEEPNRAYLLVYGHPRSDADGTDGYFGDLMGQIPDLGRVLHVDCGIARAAELSRDGRTWSLHGYGRPWRALLGIFSKWRPGRRFRRHRMGWLVRRAAAIEGGGGQAAAISWQLHCQARWLEAVRPRVVCWPWENHAWERRFVEDARRRGVATVGYQHSVVGRFMLNYRPGSNPADVRGLPDTLYCNAEAARRRLVDFGIPEDRVAVAGALRYAGLRKVAYDPRGPVFVALPFDGAIGERMVAACRAVTLHGVRFLIKDHPMTPFSFDETDRMKRCDTPLNEVPGVRSVVYAATAVGLEALAAGIPTLRFLPSDRVAIDVMPVGYEAVPVTSENLQSALEHLSMPANIPAEDPFAPVRRELWIAALGKEGGSV